jgi:hypothetical protein
MDEELLASLPSLAAELVTSWTEAAAEAAAEEAGPAVLGLAVLGTAAMQVRRWIRGFDPASNAFASVARQLPSALGHSQVHASGTQRRALDRVNELLPVETLRQQLANKKSALTTKQKLALWDEICLYRFASLIVWPILVELGVQSAAVEATVGVLARAKQQAAAAGQGGYMAGVVTSQLLARLGQAGLDFGTSLSRCSAVLLHTLAIVTEAAKAAVAKQLGPAFKCSDRFTAAALSKLFRAAFAETIVVVCQKMPQLLGGDVVDLDADADEVDLSLFSSVVMHRSFNTLAAHSSRAAFEELVVTRLPDTVKQCTGYSSEAQDAVAFQIATQLGPVLYKLSDQAPQLRDVTRDFCRKLIEANAPG